MKNITMRGGLCGAHWCGRILLGSKVMSMRNPISEGLREWEKSEDNEDSDSATWSEHLV